MSYITRNQADREIEKMMLDCKSTGNNTYYFRKLGNMSIKLRPDVLIRDWVTNYIEDKYNLTAIELRSNT